MTVQINYKKSLSKKSAGNLVLFVDEKFSIFALKKHILSSEYTYVSDLIKTKKSEEKKIVIFDISSKRKIILVSH